VLILHLETETDIINKYNPLKLRSAAMLTLVFYTNSMRFLSILLILSLLLSCKKDEPTPPVEDDGLNYVVLDYSINGLYFDESYQHDTLFGGPLMSPQLLEASGICVSRSNPSVLWSHNDSGNPNRLFAIGNKGENLGYYNLTEAGARDYEDICIGPGPIEGVNYIYLADIGDNDAQYSYIIIYRFPEPDATALDSGGVYDINSEDIERIEFTYPDGPRDAETLMIDPWTKDLYIVSKKDYRSLIYKAAYPQAVGVRTELEKIAQLPFNWTLAGDISADGTQIAIKVFNRIYNWNRNAGESVLDALKRQPNLLPYILEPQGEAFGWTEDGNGYFTLSEKSGTPDPELYFYKKN
jgi:hypothetical protein